MNPVKMIGSITAGSAWRLGAAWIAIATLAVLSLLPGDYIIRTELGGHLEHVLAYSGTAFIVASAYGPSRYLRIAAGLIGYAGALEALQRFSPGRTPSLQDFAFSTSGVLIGLVLFAITVRIVSFKRMGY